MKFLIGIAVILMLTGCASSPSTWSKETLRSEYTFQTMHAIDALQTLDIKNHPGYSESDPFLGDHPSDRTIAVWYASTAVLHGAITSVLVEDKSTPKWVCRMWEMLTIGFTNEAVVHNYNMGMKVKF